MRPTRSWEMVRVSFICGEKKRKKWNEHRPHLVVREHHGVRTLTFVTLSVHVPKIRVSSHAQMEKRTPADGLTNRPRVTWWPGGSRPAARLPWEQNTYSSRDNWQALVERNAYRSKWSCWLRFLTQDMQFVKGNESKKDESKKRTKACCFAGTGGALKWDFEFALHDMSIAKQKFQPHPPAAVRNKQSVA